MGRIITVALTLILSAMAACAQWLDRLPPHGTLFDGYADWQEVEQRMAVLPLAPVEGLWQMAQSGALFTVEREVDDATETFPRRLRLVVVKSAIRRVRPGTVMGHAVPTVKEGVYEARLYTDIAEAGGLTVPHRFLLKLDKDGNTLTIEPMKSRVKVNLLRLLPYMFRSVVTPQQSRPDGLDGAYRVYPAPSRPIVPVYL